MPFCIKCKTFLEQLEEIENDRRILFMCCPNCDYKIENINSKQFYKKYKISKTTQNKFKTNDKTLSQKISKCNKCGAINKNRYECKYLKNTFYLNYICSSCFQYFS